MRLGLLQELVDLNQAFENVARGLERMEKVALFDKEQLHYTRAEIETARADANREFFDRFTEIVAKDAEWAYKFRRDYDQKTKDPFDLYLEIKEREEVRRKKGLPPRVVLLPDWDKDDEQRRDRTQVRRRDASRRSKVAGKRKTKPEKTIKQAHASVAPAPERKE